MGIPLRCEKCGTTKKFQNLGRVVEKGWVKIHNPYGYDTWLCDKCKEDDHEDRAEEH